MKPFYLTTAIDYANGPPHLGHALEKVGADAIARYLRRGGRTVHFVVGMDEHGQKVAQSAAAAGLDPQAWVDGVAERFRAAWATLAVSYDDFIRTTEPRHHRAVAEMIRRIAARGDLYRATYAGYYCVGCEAYKTPDELVDGRCPIHPTRPIEWMEEEDWFFRLSAYREPLRRLLEERPEFCQPESRRNEVRQMIEDIRDISVSRARLRWGIPWPGDPGHVVYVWIDALTNYLSATGFPDPGFEGLWPADLHVIGKDIVRFHCVYWPALLLSAGLPLPRAVWAHGFMTLGGGKISKSAGVALGLEEAIARHGPEALRYYLLREIPWDDDGTFSLERFDERYAKDLADDLGNLVHRTLAMVERYAEGVVPPAHGDEGLRPEAAALRARYEERMDAGRLHEGLAAAMDLVAEANRFVDARAPWAAAKAGDRVAVAGTLHALVRALGAVAVLLEPFLPRTAEALWAALGAEGRPLPLRSELPAWDPTGWRVRRGPPLFPKRRAPAGVDTPSPPA